MPEDQKKRFPTWWQALTLVFGGGLLGFTSCGAALATSLGGSSRHSTLLGSILVAGFFAGAAAFVAGLVLFIFLALGAIFSR